MKVLVIGAMQEEMNVVIASLKNKSEYLHNGYKFYTGKIGAYFVVCSICGIGELNATLATFIALQNFDIDLILSIGCAGAHSADLNIGDIVIPDKVYNGASVRIGKGSTSGNGINIDRIKLRPTVIDASRNKIECYQVPSIYVNFFKRLFQEAGSKVFVGSNISSDNWNTNESWIGYLNKTHNSLIEEMEFYAIAAVAYKYDVDCCAVKIISNNEITGQSLDISVCQTLQTLLLKLIL